jgi:hypothetical protein
VGASQHDDDAKSTNRSVLNSVYAESVNEHDHLGDCDDGHCPDPTLCPDLGEATAMARVMEKVDDIEMSQLDMELAKHIQQKTIIAFARSRG